MDVHCISYTDCADHNQHGKLVWLQHSMLHALLPQVCQLNTVLAGTLILTLMFLESSALDAVGQAILHGRVRMKKRRSPATFVPA